MPSKLVTREQVPAELLRSAPRAVRLNAGGVVITILAVTMFLGACVGGVWLYVKATRETRPATAEVQEVSVTRGENPHWVFRYTYIVGGRQFEGHGRMAVRRNRSLEAGSPIPIRYSVTDPERSWIGSRESIPIWLSPLVAVCLAAGAAGMLCELRREAALLAEGRAALGRVVASRRIHKDGGHGSKTAYRLTVEFRLLSGAMQTTHFDRRKDVAVGGNVVVLYDRENPRRSRLYPLALVRTAAAV